MHKKKVLMMADYFTPGFKAGGPIVSITNLAESLIQSAHVYCIVGDRDWTDEKPYAGIKTDSWLSNEINLYYTDRNKFSVQVLLKICQELQPDIIIANSFFSPFTRVLFYCLSFGTLKTKTAIFVRGELNSGALSNKGFIKQLFKKLLVILGVARKVVWIATSPKELEEIKIALGDNISHKLISNLPKQPLKRDITIFKSPHSVKFAFIGRIDPMKNLAFFLESLTLISGGNIIFDIYGPIRDIKYWNTCKEIINRVNNNSIKIQYLGAIEPPNISSTLCDYHFFIQPSISENFGHSIYDALANRLPVIISNTTPWNNLYDKQAGWDLALDKAKWIPVIYQCLEMDNNHYVSMSDSAFKYAESEYKNIAQNVESGIAELLFAN